MQAKAPKPGYADQIARTKLRGKSRTFWCGPIKIILHFSHNTSYIFSAAAGTGIIRIDLFACNYLPG